ncbi:MAG: nicotinate-nicotinamide nucleotide adenylyltransferase [Phycisphaeraceae bacterium]|nr:MAG: nicotinate-nicotinamide nucleotide adenylyltransferase [Phycisphaeraceae bacterium]
MSKRSAKPAASATRPAQRGTPGEAPITPLEIPRNVKTLVVFGGSFDPPHFMHIAAPIMTVVRMYGPKEGWLLYVPAARSPHKQSVVAPDDHRLAMLRLAIDIPGPRSIWTDELDRARWQREHKRKPSPSYTIDTLRRLHSIVPARVKLRLLIGSDQVWEFHRWKEPREIIRLAEPLVLAREPTGSVSSVYAALDDEFWTREEKREWCARLAPNFPLEAASTSVRLAIPGAPHNAEAWKRRKALRDIPTPVARHIIASNLYGFRAGTPRDLAPEEMPQTLTGDTPGTMERVRNSLILQLAKNVASPTGSRKRKRRPKPTSKPHGARTPRNTLQNKKSLRSKNR